MTKFIPLLAAVAVLAAIAVGASSAHPTASCPTVTSGQLTIGTDNPAYPPWYAGGTKSSTWKINDPATGKGYESAVAYAVAKQLGFAKRAGEVDVRAVQQARSRPGRSRSTSTSTRSRTRPRARRSSTSASRTTTSTRRSSSSRARRSRRCTASPGLQPFKLGAQLGTTSYAYIKSTIKPSQQPAVFHSNAAAVIGAQEQADRRARRRPADRVLRDRRAGAELEDPRPVREHAGNDERPFGMVLAKGNPLDGLRQQGDRDAAVERRRSSGSSSCGWRRRPARRS